jgi:hypothetical protein
MLLMAAGAQAAEAAGLFVAVILNVVDSVSGDAWTTSNATAFIVMEAIIALAVAWIASGIARFRPWSRTPAVMTQVFTILIALWLLEAHRWGWGLPALLLAIAALVGLFAPTSLRALHRSISPGGGPPDPRMGGSRPPSPPGGSHTKPV